MVDMYFALRPKNDAHGGFAENIVGFAVECRFYPI